MNLSSDISIIRGRTASLKRSGRTCYEQRFGVGKASSKGDSAGWTADSNRGGSADKRSQFRRTPSHHVFSRDKINHMGMDMLNISSKTRLEPQAAGTEIWT